MSLKNKNYRSMVRVQPAWNALRKLLIPVFPGKGAAKLFPGKRRGDRGCLKLLSITNQINACSRVPLEKLIVPQLVKKFPAFPGNRKLINVSARARYLSVS